DGMTGIRIQGKQVYSEDIELRWSPDGGRLAILERKQGITLYQPVTAGFRKYKFDVENAGYEISPVYLDEETFLFARGKNIIELSLPDGEVEVAYRADNAITSFSASPEGYKAISDILGRIIITIPVNIKGA
ncbi:MAG: hypothetical protein J7M18_06090, partial [Candidatus Eremiobacteraeota bacterium]|nr:hypothetical protein [Candidatus Eremiobacteraeota bacterium]